MIGIHPFLTQGKKMRVNLSKGIETFQTSVFPQKHALFKSLETGQNPSVLMITCADSRIIQSLITQSEPGEVFVCRNAGNIVPPYGTINDGTTASIEFALASFEIETIIICGHSDCGAMKGVMNRSALEHLPTTDNWLGFAPAGQHADLKDLTLHNIKQQLSNMMSYPSVQDKLQTGQLTMEGWFYNIGDGTVTKIHV